MALSFGWPGADVTAARVRRSPSSWCRPQPHAGPAHFSIDEFHPGVFQGPPDSLIVGPGKRGRARHQFGTANSGDAHHRVAGEVFRAPADQRTRGTDLRADQWGWGHLDRLSICYISLHMECFIPAGKHVIIT